MSSRLPLPPGSVPPHMRKLPPLPPGFKALPSTPKGPMPIPPGGSPIPPPAHGRPPPPTPPGSGLPPPPSSAAYRSGVDPSRAPPSHAYPPPAGRPSFGSTPPPTYLQGGAPPTFSQGGGANREEERDGPGQRPPLYRGGDGEDPSGYGGGRGEAYASSPPPFYGRGRGGDRGFRSFRGGGGGGGGMGEDRPLRQATNTVWAGNLDTSVHNEDFLRQVFSEFGVVMRIAPHMEHNYCFVHFRTIEEASNAVSVLRERGTLGGTRFNYGKMYEYTEEEMQPDYVPPGPRFKRGRGDDFRGGMGGDDAAPYGGGPRGSRRPHLEPSRVLWVGSLPETMSDQTLKDIFSTCGNVRLVSRLERRNMAFIHFDTVEECTLALETLSGKPVERNVVLALNYGHPERSKDEDGGNGSESHHRDDPSNTAAVIAANETPTNVVYLGQIPPDATDIDIDNLFEPFEGFIHAKFLSNSNIAFGHFDTIEHARIARIALHNVTVKGVPIRVNFGKNNHSFTMEDRAMQFNNGADLNLEDLMRLPDGGGALMTLDGRMTPHGGDLTLPSMGGRRDLGELAQSYQKEREPPELNLKARLQTVMGSTYNSCGAKNAELSPHQMEIVCTATDQCVDDATSQQLHDTLMGFLPFFGVHIFCVITKRMKEFYDKDPIRKLWVFYAVTKAFLASAAKTPQLYIAASLNAYLMVMLVASEEQSREGVDRLSIIVNRLQHHQLLEQWSNISEEYKVSFRSQMKEIYDSAVMRHELSAFLSSRKQK